MTGAGWEIAGALGAAAGLLVILAPWGGRDAQAITCPETPRRARIRVEAVPEEEGSAFERFSFQVTACSLWPARRGCGRECAAAFGKR